MPVRDLLQAIGCGAVILIALAAFVYGVLVLIVIPYLQST